ncbi:MAG: hypothetical protein ACFB0B_14170 [Thermonemataceae bacterium]
MLPRRFVHYIYVLITVTLLACGIEKDKYINEDDPNFSTSDASRLFFKNTRQIYYDKQVIGKDRLELYRKKSRSDDEKRPHLNLILANNWMYDEAYIRFEPSPSFANPVQFEIIWKKDERSGRYQLEDNSKESHYKLATLLYRGILKEQSFYLKQDDKEIPILSDQKERDTFRITMIDFYRLVNVM